MNNTPMVSVCCLAYNHATYIRQCLDSLVNQETNFSFEILIHDDCSTDGTTEIIREYESQYPDVIKPIYEVENQYSKGIPVGSFAWNFPRAKGKYIAMCECDDYWTDSHKLQKQFDFMESHPEHSLCCHAHINVYPDGTSTELHRYSTDVEICPIKDIIMIGGGFMATNSMFFVTEYILPYPEWAVNAPVGDAAWNLILSYKGKVGYLNEVMSAYRCSAIGSWSSALFKSPKKLYIHNKGIRRMYIQYNRWSHWANWSIVLRRQLINELAALKHILKAWLQNK